VDRASNIYNSNSISNALPNPNLRPELLQEYEVGFEGKLFNNRMNVDFTYYNRNSKDQILSRSLDPSTGFTVTSINAGSVRNKGIELQLGYNVIRNKDWNWQVNLIGSDQVNAFCMPGGKIAFFHGILNKLNLTDDEVAMVMGHEIAHALREHARERMGKSMATNTLSKIGGALASVYLGVDPRLTDAVAMQGANLINLKFSREDESEADLVGMELAARAGYNPRAGVSLWQKMSAANKGAPPQWMSTHPSGSARIKDIQANLPKVNPLYQRAGKP
jgi:outer membrane receptor for ferrienterochelin and colicin